MRGVAPIGRIQELTPLQRLLVVASDSCTCCGAFSFLKTVVFEKLEKHSNFVVSENQAKTEGFVCVLGNKYLWLFVVICECHVF